MNTEFLEVRPQIVWSIWTCVKVDEFWIRETYFTCIRTTMSLNTIESLPNELLNRLSCHLSGKCLVNLATTTKSVNKSLSHSLLRRRYRSSKVYSPDSSTSSRPILDLALRIAKGEAPANYLDVFRLHESIA